MRQYHCELVLTTRETCKPIHNMYPAYIHDLAAYGDALPNPFGVLSDNPEIHDWPSYMEDQRAWWKTPEYLFPYMVLADGIPAGFNFVAAGPYVPTEGVDYVVYEFFVANAFRGSNVAFEAAKLGFEQHKGEWEVVTYPKAERPKAFWRKALGELSGGSLKETEGEHPFGQKVIWRFSNGE